MKPTITIFTPTYNRRYVIHKCYESLKRQTNKNFKWLVIDDGSTDNTEELIAKWKEEANFPIDYIYKKNGGMHTAHNKAYEIIDTELNVCIDSDDYMPDDAIEKILRAWEENKSENIAGLAGLDAYKNGTVIGVEFPKHLRQSNLFDLYHKYKITGDKKLVYRTELTRMYPYPEFEGEKYVGLDYKCHKIEEGYKLALINEIFCIVEYMEDGSSKNMLRQYKNNPRGWQFYRLENLKMKDTTFLYKFKEAAHYISSSLMINDKNFLKITPYKFLTILALPVGYLLYLYIAKNTKV